MNRDSLLKLRQRLELALDSGTPEAYRDLAEGLAEMLERIKPWKPEEVATDGLGRALEVLEAAWNKGTPPPAALPGSPECQARLAGLLSNVLAAQSFAIAMSRGDLSPSLRAKGLMAGGLKALQANLRHLTWQTQMIARGDFEQRVDFMGDFSESFNFMVASLKAARDQLIEANQDLEAFSYSVSHDLRAPLRAIEGFACILAEDHARQLDAEGMRLLGVITASVRHMANLINDLLAFSRSGRREITKTDIDMNGLVQGISRQIKDWGLDRIFRLTIKELPPAYGDLALLNQVWFNILSNAVKFTGPKKNCVIEVGGRSEGRENIYYVKDNGVGFDMEHSQQLFGVFQRLHAHSEFEGTGVGLAIVQKIIHRHGGRVWAEGKVNEGAIFYFSLPMN